MDPRPNRQSTFLTLFLMAFCVLLVGCSGGKRVSPVSVELFPDRGIPEMPTLLGVGLLEKQDVLELGADGRCNIRESESGKTLAHFSGDQQKLICRRSDEGVSWTVGDRSGTASAVTLQPLDPKTRVIVGGDAYRGEFLVIPTPNATTGLTLVNNVELEDYLKGVVPWEIGRHQREKMAALEAQSIAARTYTISHLGARKSRGFDVFATVMDQVYKGASGEDKLCNEAIANTSSVVLRWRGKEIDAYYSACCGGQSSQIEEVWPKEASAYLINHKDSATYQDDPFCSASRYYNWTESWTAAGLEATLQKTLPEYVAWMSVGSRGRWAGPLFSPSKGGVDPEKPGRLINLEVIDRTRSGRVAQLVITTEAGTYHVRGDRTRWVLKPASGNPSILRSAFFELKLERSNIGLQKITATGRGYGHGIGLCQTGALEMARRGYSSQAILEHYYPDTVWTRLNRR